MRIIYVVRENLNLFPPCISQILMLKDLGIDVEVLAGSIHEELRAVFDNKNIEYTIVGTKRVNNGKLGKIQSYYNYRKAVLKHIKHNNLEDEVFWFGTADSAFSLYPYIKKKKFILNILELYDTNTFYRENIKLIASSAIVVIANELNRAYIMQKIYNLQELPIIMPNKPYKHHRERNITMPKEYENLLSEEVINSKIIIYQGIISTDRSLNELALALNKINKDYTLLLMGEDVDNTVNTLKEIYPKTVYIGYVPAPEHLFITSYAYIGIANYDDSTLNNVFCAPNKTYEYAGYGIPILGSNVPGLIYTVGSANAGICVDFNNVNDITKSLKSIEKNYTFYSSNASKFYNNEDNLKKVKEILEKLQLR